MNYLRFYNYLKFFFLFMIIMLFSGCGDNNLPINEIRNSMKNVPVYSIILNDMKEEGNFFKEYFHQYRIVQPDLSWDKGWFEVPEKYYRSTEGLLGMALFGKKDEEILDAAFPPVYSYVGDNRYGQWKPDGTGGMLWAFSRSTPFFNQLDIDLHRPVYQKDYKAYQESKYKKVPFFGLNKEYGTSGSFTKKMKPDFFARRMAKERIQQASFADKVSSRIGRTKTNFRGRSGSRGK